MSELSRRSKKHFFINKDWKRKPLFGYYDMRGDLLTLNSETRFDPMNNEYQASQLIDLPTALSRSIGISTDYAEDKRYRFKDPYSDQYKTRLMNAWYMDPVINQSILIRTSHVLGKGMRTVLEADPSAVLGQERDPKVILSEMLSDQEQSDLMSYISKVERLTQIYDKHQRLVLDWFVGGRSGQFMLPANQDALTKFALPKGTPAFLIDLEWNRLGQVKLDKNDRIDKIEYRDNSKFPVDQDTQPEDEKGYGKFLPYQDMIYFTRNDKYYGRSIIQTILSVSEQNRMMNEQDLPEICKARWAPSMLFWSKEMSEEEGEDFIADRDPAKDSFVKAEIHSEILQTNADPAPLAQLRHENARFMLMQLDVPSYLMKMEDVTNRATAVSVLAVWRNLTLEYDRNTFRDMMWNQFYKKLVILWFGQSKPNFDIIDQNYRIGYIFDNLSVTDDESESRVVDVLQRHGIETLKESRRRMNLPAEMEEIDTMETVLDNEPNANAIGTTRNNINNLVGSAKEQMLELMRRNRMPSDMIAAAEDWINSNNRNENNQ